MTKTVDLLLKTKEFIWDLLYPKSCLNCGQPGSYLCGSCLTQLSLNQQFYCALCHQPSQQGRICPACQRTTSLQAIWLAADYNNEVLQKVISYWKYKYVEDLGQVLASLVVKYLEVNNIFRQAGLNKGNCLITAVPLHRQRFLSRGFNQSAELAKILAKQYDFIWGDLLIRPKNTETQVNLNRAQRQVNVQNAFALAADVQPILSNKKIILIDDVVTTGSTLKECAKILTQAGSDEVYGLVIAQRED